MDIYINPESIKHEQKAAFIKDARGKDVFIKCGDEWYKVAFTQFGSDSKYKWYRYTMMTGVIYLHYVGDKHTFQ